jgi:hypothetical protein
MRTVKLTPTTQKIVARYAKERDEPFDETLAALVVSGDKRLRASRRWADEHRIPRRSRRSARKKAKR